MLQPDEFISGYPMRDKLNASMLFFRRRHSRRVAVKMQAEASDLLTSDSQNGCLVKQLDTIEQLIKEGYIGEARFTIRKTMEHQAVNVSTRYALEKMNQDLLMSRSLANLTNVKKMLHKIRQTVNAA